MDELHPFLAYSRNRPKVDVHHHSWNTFRHNHLSTGGTRSLCILWPPSDCCPPWLSPRLLYIHRYISCRYEIHRFRCQQRTDPERITSCGASSTSISNISHARVEKRNLSHKNNTATSRAAIPHVSKSFQYMETSNSTASTPWPSGFEISASSGESNS